MGDRVRNQDPERFAQISDTVIAAAGAPGLDLNDEFAALEAIGNLGPKQVRETLRKFLESDDAFVRQKAVLSLQRIPVEEAYPSFQNAIQSDVEETVRAAAAKLVGETRWAEGYPDLANAAQKDPSELVRMAAVAALGEWGPENEEAIQVLRSVVVHDPAEQVRDVAAQILTAPEVERGEH